jgi:hypothetical protein
LIVKLGPGRKCFVLGLLATHQRQFRHADSPLQQSITFAAKHGLQPEEMEISEELA